MAKKAGLRVLILDTAGRSQLDGALMDELQAIRKRVTPAETLLVVDSMIGQEAVNVAKGFRDNVTLTGLTKILSRPPISREGSLGGTRMELASERIILGRQQMLHWPGLVKHGARSTHSA